MSASKNLSLILTVSTANTRLCLLTEVIKEKRKDNFTFVE